MNHIDFAVQMIEKVKTKLDVVATDVGHAAIDKSIKSGVGILAVDRLHEPRADPHRDHHAEGLLALGPELLARSDHRAARRAPVQERLGRRCRGLDRDGPGTGLR